MINSCWICEQERAVTQYWNPCWWRAGTGPVFICPKCKDDWFFEGCFLNEDSTAAFQSVKCFINFTEREKLDEIRKKLATEGQVIRGNAGEFFSLNCKFLVRFENEDWLVLRESVVNFGTSNKFVELIDLGKG